MCWFGFSNPGREFLLAVHIQLIKKDEIFLFPKSTSHLWKWQLQFTGYIPALFTCMLQAHPYALVWIHAAWGCISKSMLAFSLLFFCDSYECRLEDVVNRLLFCIVTCLQGRGNWPEMFWGVYKENPLANSQSAPPHAGYGSLSKGGFAATHLSPPLQ